MTRLLTSLLTSHARLHRAVAPLLMAVLALGLGACGGDTTAPKATGGLSFELSGLPSGAQGIVSLHLGSVSKTVSESKTLEGLDVGEWTLTAEPVIIDGTEYEPQPASQVVNVPARSVGSARVVWTPVTGALNLSVSGLPAGLDASIVVSNGTISRTITGSTVVTGLRAGEYTVTSRDVRGSTGVYRATQPTQLIAITASPLARSASVIYDPAAAVIDVALSGLPSTANAAITLTPPNGATLTVATSTRVTPAVAGRWRLQAGPVQSGGFTYTPSPSSYDDTVLSGDTLRFPVSYSVTTGALAVAVTGLPQGAAGSVTVTGPNGFTRALTATATLTDLSPGTYTVSADSVVRSGLAWRPSSTSQQITVAASLTAAPATVNYTAVIGTLVVSLSGVPVGSTGSARITGPYGFDRTITSTTVMPQIAAGSYTIAATSFAAGAVSYAATPAVVTRTVAIGGRDSLDVRYAASVGSLQVTVTGLPGVATATIALTGANVNMSIPTSTTIGSLATGAYTLTATAVNVNGTNYLPTPSTQNLTINNNAQTSATVAYSAAVTTGSVVVSVSGLPAGTNASAALTGNSQNIAITGTATLTNLAAGSYTLSANNVVSGGTTYAPTPSSQGVTISAGAQSNASIVYTAVVAATGNVQITVNGLPVGVNASATLTRGALNTAVTGSTTVTASVGSWTLTAASVTSAGTTYNPAPTTQSVTISTGVTSTATITYTAAAAGGTDLILDQAYLTQATQKLDGSVALVAGRDALLRVFAHASAANSINTTVRARIYDGATLLQTLTLTGPTSVPTAIDEGTLSSTWNSVITGANIRTNTKILVDIDPSNTTTESDETNNIWPANGTPRSITVNTVPAFNIRFVPVTVGGKSGNVTAGNMASFLVTAKKVWPILAVNADVRAPFTSAADTLVSNDSNNKWLTVLSEMNTLRATDAAPSTMHYYGVVKVGYSSGVAGYGYVPGRAAVGWDYLPSGDGVAAHELGHNFSAPHAPCGGAASPDASYPYAGALIGSWGWNSATNTLVSPTTAVDIMSYCSPTWISDYNWSKVMTYRQSSGSVATASVNGEGLLVWGRIVNGTVQLEPAFRVTAPATAAARRPTHHVEALDATGTVLLDLPIAAEQVDHVTDHQEQQFAVVVPWTAALEEALTQLRVRDVRTPLMAASRSSAAAMSARLTRGVKPARPMTMATPDAVLEAAPAGRARVRWNSTAYPMAMVRDAATGQVMAYVRRSGDAVVTGGRTLEIVTSDGVRSVVQKLR